MLLSIATNKKYRVGTENLDALLDVNNLKLKGARKKLLKMKTSFEVLLASLVNSIFS